MRIGIAAGLAVAVVLLLGVTTAYALGTNQANDNDDDTAGPALNPAELGMLVSGSGAATGVPDQLRFAVTVRHSAADVFAAMNATSADVRKVVRALTGQGIALKDIGKANVSVRPTYRYADGQEQITGYSASEKVSVKVRDIKAAGKVISATAAAAGNAVRIGGIAMSVADPSQLQAQARANAIADARKKAEQFAKAAGRHLGEVVVVEESTPPTPDYELQRSAFDSPSAATAGSVPINPGTQTTKVYVQVRWSFT
jgi:uncharacterized protein YggE